MVKACAILKLRVTRAPVSARRRQENTNPWFKRGTLFHEALGVPRTATAPMTGTEIGHAVLAANILTDTADRKQRLGIEGGIQSDPGGPSPKDGGTGRGRRVEEVEHYNLRMTGRRKSFRLSD
jgi:hypothetical protein